MNKDKEESVAQFKIDFLPKYRIWWATIEDVRTMHNNMFIEQVLLHGDIDDWERLKNLFSAEKIRKVFFWQMLFSTFYDIRKEKIVVYFLGVKNPKVYLQRMRNLNPANHERYYKRKDMELA